MLLLKCVIVWRRKLSFGRVAMVFYLATLFLKNKLLVFISVTVFVCGSIDWLHVGRILVAYCLVLWLDAIDARDASHWMFLQCEVFINVCVQKIIGVHVQFVWFFDLCEHWGRAANSVQYLLFFSSDFCCILFSAASFIAFFVSGFNVELWLKWIKAMQVTDLLFLKQD